jgi:hypothetical protein
VLCTFLRHSIGRKSAERMAQLCAAPWRDRDSELSLRGTSAGARPDIAAELFRDGAWEGPGAAASAGLLAAEVLRESMRVASGFMVCAAARRTLRASRSSSSSRRCRACMARWM